MARFPEPARSRAVLVGASRFPKASELPPIPAVQANLEALRQTLTDPVAGTIAPQGCRVVSDPADMQSVGPVLGHAIGEATDVLLVYYAGHGLLDDKGHLYLSLTETDPALLRYTALPLETLRQDLADSPAAIRILILDCCFSGRAIEAMSGEQGLITGQVEIAGTYTLTSTTANSPSHAPTGEPYTAFTGALLQAFAQPEPQTLDAIYHRAAQQLAARGLPRPQRRALNTAGGLALSRGSASATPAPMMSTEVRLSADASTVARQKQKLLAGVGTLSIINGAVFLMILLQAGVAGALLSAGIPMLICLYFMRLALAWARGPVPKLVVDSVAIGFEKPGRSVRVPWSDISHIGLMRGTLPNGRRPRKNHEEQLTVVTARLHPQAPIPKSNVALISQAHRDLGYIGICTLGAIGADRGSLLAALEPFAGPRLVHTSREFLHIDPRLNPDMV